MGYISTELKLSLLELWAELDVRQQY